MNGEYHLLINGELVSDSNHLFGVTNPSNETVFSIFGTEILLLCSQASMIILLNLSKLIFGLNKKSLFPNSIALDGLLSVWQPDK